MFVDKAYAESMAQVSHSQQEASKIKTQFEQVESEKIKLEADIQSKVEKINQLEQENAELKG